MRRDIIGEAPVQEPAKSFAAPHMLSAREESDNYKDVVAVLTPKLRVIRCRDGIQWIAQRQNNKRAGVPIWTSFAYCGTKEGLLMRLSAGGENCDPKAWTIIEALPDYFPKVEQHCD